MFTISSVLRSEQLQSDTCKKFTNRNKSKFNNITHIPVDDFAQSEPKVTVSTL